MPIHHYFYFRGKCGGVGTFSSTFPPPLGMYVTFGFDVSDCTIALLASIFLNATNPSPARSSAFEIVAAASASPSAPTAGAFSKEQEIEKLRTPGS